MSDELYELLGYIVQRINTATIVDKEWLELVNWVREFCSGDQQHEKTSFLLGLMMGSSEEGKLSVADALKLALVKAEKRGVQ